MFISRSQADSAEVFAAQSDETATVIDQTEVWTRQEFKKDSDVNEILRRAGAGGFEARPVQYGVQDTDLELQAVYTAAVLADEAWLRLPERLRGRYPGWSELLAAIEAGEASLVDPDGVVTAPSREPVPPVEAPVVP